MAHCSPAVSVSGFAHPLISACSIGFYVAFGFCVAFILALSGPPYRLLICMVPATSAKLINRYNQGNEHVNEIMVLADLRRRINAAFAQINKEP